MVVLSRYATSAKDNSNIDLAVKEMLQQALKGGARWGQKPVAAVINLLA